jgi:hypothetical protein
MLLTEPGKGGAQDDPPTGVIVASWFESNQETDEEEKR